jgi:hypothetical protein
VLRVAQLSLNQKAEVPHRIARPRRIGHKSEYGTLKWFAVRVSAPWMRRALVIASLVTFPSAKSMKNFFVGVARAEQCADTVPVMPRMSRPA